MTVQRWATTTVAMAVLGLALWAAAPDLGTVAAATTDPQRLVDTQGPDALVTLLAWALSALCWAWGSVGLLLTAASAGPGLCGRLSRALLGIVLPAGLRRAAALAVGVSLVAAPGVALGAPGPPAATPLVRTATDAAVPAWSDVGPAPADAAPPVPDWPETDERARRGARRLPVGHRRAPARRARAVTDGQVQAAVQAWWQANAAVVGPDPDLLLPGQVLHAPPAP